MKKRKWVLFLFLLLSQAATSQVNLKLDVLNLAFGFPTTRSIRIASEIQFAENYSVQGEYGISWHQIAPKLNKDIRNMYGNMWQSEIRRYFAFHGDKGWYFALNYSQKNQQYDRLWTTVQTLNGEFIHEDQWLEVTRKEQTINLIFGYQSNQNEQRRFLIEAYAGVGIRSRKIESDLSPNWKLVNGNGWKLLDEQRHPILPNVIVGVKVGLQVLQFNHRKQL